MNKIVTAIIVTALLMGVVAARAAIPLPVDRPTSTPKPILQLTQEFIDFCNSTPYQGHIDCPPKRGPIGPIEYYANPPLPGLMIVTPDCNPAAYPWVEEPCNIFSGADNAPIDDPYPTVTPHGRYNISKPRGWTR